MSKLAPIDLECNMCKDINGVEQRDPWKAYDIDEVDALLAKKDKEIRKLKRALYKACANWADVVAFEETEGIGYDNSVAERWRKMERKCLKKAEEFG